VDAFETVVAGMLSQQGYWVWPSYKVKLTKREKSQIGRASSPRWEIDLVAYRGATNQILAVECKSFLDSRGVTLRALTDADTRFAVRFKLFHDATLRRVVLSRLARQLIEVKACAPKPVVQLCLAAGRVATAEDRKGLHKHFAKKRWQFWDEKWIGDCLERMAASGYQNDVATIVAKLTLRTRRYEAGDATDNVKLSVKPHRTPRCIPIRRDPLVMPVRRQS